MSTVSAFFLTLLIINAAIFIALTFFRRDRPDRRTRLFRWVVHTPTQRRPRNHHSSLPA